MIPDIHPDGSSSKARRESDRSIDTLSQRFGDALLVSDGKGAEAIAMDCLKRGMSVETLYGRVIAPAMWECGRLWESGEINVADEHMSTAIAIRVMSRVYAESLERVRRPGRIMLAAAEGQIHDVGLRMAADILELAGFEVVYLGGDVPVGDLIDSATRFEPDLIGLSTILDDNRGTVEHELREISRAFPEMPIMIGGPAVPGNADEIETVVLSGQLENLVELVESLLERWGASFDSEMRLALASKTDLSPATELDSPAGRQLQNVADLAQLARSQTRVARSFRDLAYLDATTGGPNRRAFDDRLAVLAEGAGDPPACLVIFDIDYFKQVNDSLGHEAGDRILQEVSQTIKSTLRDDDLVARLGGDEFGVLLANSDLARGERVAVRVLEAIDSAGSEPPVTATAGVSLIGHDGRHAMVRADTALYHAKHAGRNRVAVAGDDS